MATTAYFKTGLTGGAATALDSISGAGLLQDDFAFCMVSNVLYIYILNATSGAAESSPDVIAPDTAPGTKRWILQNWTLSGFTASALKTLVDTAEDIVWGT